MTQNKQLGKPKPKQNTDTIPFRVSIPKDKVDTVYSKNILLNAAICLPEIRKCLTPEDNLVIETVHQIENSNGNVTMVDVLFKINDKSITIPFYYDGIKVKPILTTTEKTKPESLSVYTTENEYGLYNELYDFYRELLKQGMAERYINSFQPNQTDQATAAVFYTKGYIRFSDGLGWVVYNPKNGTFSDNLGTHILHYCLEMMAKERWDLRNTEDKEYLDYAKKACTEQDIQCVMRKIRSEPNIITLASDYDNNPYLINCQGITVDLRTGERRPSTQKDLYTKTTLCKPAEQLPIPEDYPVFAQFLIDVTNRNSAMIGWIMRFLGYSLSGDTKTAFFVNLHGAGRNGKGTLLHAMQHIFANYAAEIPTAVVVDNGKYQKIEHAHARLLGVRLGVASDVPPGRMNIESLNMITGNDMINAEFKYKNSFTFRPVAKIILSTNEQLRLSTTGQSVKSRLRYVPFSVSFAGREDTTLEERIKTEAPEILAALIGEAVEYFKDPGPRNFPDCAVIDRETKAYITSEDIIGQFLEECTVQVEGEKIPAGELYKAYRDWSEKRYEKPMTNTMFGRKMGDRITKERTRDKDKVGTFYCNIKFRGIYT